jgi:hypothetical protein
MRGVWSSKVKAVKKDTPMVTVDVGMTSNMGYCTTADGRDIKPFKFGNTRERHIRERTALLNQLQQLVFIMFPEFKMVIKDIKIKTARWILRNYKTPDKI